MVSLELGFGISIFVKVSGKNRKGRREMFSYLNSPKSGYNDSSSQAASLASCVPQQ